MATISQIVSCSPTCGALSRLPALPARIVGKRPRIALVPLPEKGENWRRPERQGLGKRYTATGFVALPKRWIVERTFAWLGRCKKVAKDWECLNNRALAFLRLASIRLMLRKLCNRA